MDEKKRKAILELGDVDLVRLLTVHADQQTAEVIEFATEEANRRGVPIDEGFIPNEERKSAGIDPAEWLAGGVALRCPHCGGAAFDAGRMLTRSPGLIMGLLANELHTMACKRCGLVQMFAVPPEQAS